MSAAGAIVVRRAERVGGYRDALRDDALVLEQVARRGWAGGRRLAALGAPIAAATALAATIPAQALVVMAGGLVVAGVAVWRVREGLEPRARLIVTEGALRVYRPVTEVVHEIAAEDVIRVDLVGADETLEDAATTWTLVAYTRELAYPLLHTGDRRAGLRVRTLIVERLARDGAWRDAPMSSVRCPGCRAGIVLPASALPSEVACAQCGRIATMALVAER